MAKRKREVSEFGAYLAKAIEETGMYKTDFYTAVGMNKPYFYEILTGTPPPRGTLEKMLDLLEEKLPPDENRRNTFFDLAAKSRQEIPADIHDLIKANPKEWNNIRTALNQLLAARK